MKYNWLIKLYPLGMLLILIACSENDKLEFEFLSPDKECAEMKWHQIEEMSVGLSVKCFEAKNGIEVCLDYDEFEGEIISETWYFYDLYESHSEGILKFFDRRSNYSIHSLKIVSCFNDDFDYGDSNSQNFILRNSSEKGILFDCYISRIVKNQRYRLSVGHVW
ncbi:MAG: hypothetical protein GQ574_22870 [Crocinitomix sp.]|nr:hypothetical protein [Crocinitomix sp.]